MMPKKAALVVAVLAQLLAAPSSSAPAAPRPKLLVLLVVDQMRADYFDRYGVQWTKGLRRLFDQGAHFRRAAYPYLATLTCPGHATIGTGTYPATHGVALNAWWDREARRLIACTEDPDARPVFYDNAAVVKKEGNSARQLVVPTLADEIKAQLGRSSRVVALSMKPRSAIMLGGRTPDAVVWFGGAWATSSAFADAPVAAIVQAIAAIPLPSGPALVRWEQGPEADQHLALLARGAALALFLGRGPGVDYLAISFSTLDGVGHAFGPASAQVQDVLARLDATLGALLDDLDRRLGSDGYVVALTADHGVAPLPETVQAQGRDAGRISLDLLKSKISDAVATVLGPGKYVSSVQYADVYLVPGVLDKLRSRRGAVARVLAAARSVPGIIDAFAADQIRDRRKAKTPLQHAAALSYFPERSGDIVIAPKANWLTVDQGTTHGTAHSYDQRVPLVLMGAGIRPGRYDRAVTPADIAPTLARLAGIKMPRAEGQPLLEALVSAPEARGSRRARPAIAPPRR